MRTNPESTVTPGNGVSIARGRDRSRLIRQRDAESAKDFARRVVASIAGAPIHSATLFCSSDEQEAALETRAVLAVALVRCLMPVEGGVLTLSSHRPSSTLRALARTLRDLVGPKALAIREEIASRAISLPLLGAGATPT